MLSWQVKMMISNGMFKKKKNKERKKRKKKKKNTANIKQLSGLRVIGTFEKQAPDLETFRAGKAILCCCVFIQDQSFNNFESDTMKLSVN